MLFAINAVFFAMGMTITGVCTYSLVAMTSLIGASGNPTLAGNVLWGGVCLGIAIACVALAGCYGASGLSKSHHFSLFVYCVVISVFVFAQLVFIAFFFLSSVKFSGDENAGKSELEKDMDALGDGVEALFNTTYATCFNSTSGMIKNSEDNVCTAVKMALNVTRIDSAQDLRRYTMSFLQLWIAPICISVISIGVIELICMFMAIHVLNYQGGNPCVRKKGRGAGETNEAENEHLEHTEPSELEPKVGVRVDRIGGNGSRNPTGPKSGKYHRVPE